MSVEVDVAGEVVVGLVGREREAAHIAVVLLAVVHPEPVFPERFFGVFEDAFGRCKLNPRLFACTRAGDESPDIEKSEAALFYFVDYYVYSVVEECLIVAPRVITELLVFVELFGNIGGSRNMAYRREGGCATGFCRSGRLHEPPRVVR